MTNSLGIVVITLFLSVCLCLVTRCQSSEEDVTNQSKKQWTPNISRNMGITSAYIITMCNFTLSQKIPAAWKADSAAFSKSFDTYVKNINSLPFYYADIHPKNDKQLCQLFEPWARWVNQVFTITNCWENSKWCNYTGRLKKDGSNCTPYFCRTHPNELCTFYGKEGRCFRTIPCIVNCLKITATSPKWLGEYFGLLLNVWGTYLNSSVKKSTLIDDTVVSFRRRVLSQYSMRTKEDNVNSRLSQLISRLQSRQNWLLDFDKCPTQSTVCNMCASRSSGSMCKEYDDTCCICITF